MLESLKAAPVAPHRYLLVVTNLKWPVGSTITVAFKGGSRELHAQIARVASEWSSIANIHFDFGLDLTTGNYRTWPKQDGKYAGQVRISFNYAADRTFWSVNGTESIKGKFARPDQPSMNLEGFDEELPPDWERIVRHEFGHVLGLEHEHQSPKAPCDWRFNDDRGYSGKPDQDGRYPPLDGKGRRPGLYKVLGGPPNNWSRTDIDLNIKKLPASSAYLIGPFDAKSIMKYYQAEWMFVKGVDSLCYSRDNSIFSDEDRKRISSKGFYPFDPEVAKLQTQELATEVEALLPQVGQSALLVERLQAQRVFQLGY